MPRKRLPWSAAGLPLDPENDSYAYRKNIAMLIDAGLSFDEINQAAKDLYEDGVYLDDNKKPMDEYRHGSAYLMSWLVSKKVDPLYNFLKVFVYHPFAYFLPQKVWVTDKETECKGYEIYARSLKITSSNDSSYWEWERESQSRSDGRSVDVEVARLKEIKWLEVRGKFPTIKLTANTTYKVYFILKATDDSWEDIPVTFRLYVPGTGRQERQQELWGPLTNDDYETYEVGQFHNNRRTVGTIEFHMEELSSKWKEGLIIKGVRIEPCQVND